MENIYKNLHSNQKIVILEMLKRGISVDVFDEKLEIIKCEYKGHVEYLYDRDSSVTPYNMSIIAGNKALTKRILEDNGISAPIGISFYPTEIDEILASIKIIGFPITIKPVNGSHGYDVYTNLNSERECLDVIKKIYKRLGNVPILIEEYYEALEYRVFITKNRDYAVLLRDCAYVIGDGIHTLRSLIDIENYNRFHPRNNALCEILVDDEMMRFLSKKGLDLEFIPEINEKVYLRPNSNVAMGGVCVDYTDEVHPSVIDIAYKTLQAFPGLPYIGIDYMTNSITEEQNDDTYRIIEVNTVPGVHMHFRPGIGKSRNIAEYMVDVIYPETKLEKGEKNERRKELTL